MIHKPKRSQTCKEFPFRVLLRLSLHPLSLRREETASQGSGVRPTGRSGFMCWMLLWTGLWRWGLEQQATEVLLFTRRLVREGIGAVTGRLQLLWTWKTRFIMFFTAAQQPHWLSLWVRLGQRSNSKCRCRCEVECSYSLETHFWVLCLLLLMDLGILW